MDKVLLLLLELRVEILKLRKNKSIAKLETTPSDMHRLLLVQILLVKDIRSTVLNKIHNTIHDQERTGELAADRGRGPLVELREEIDMVSALLKTLQLLIGELGERALRGNEAVVEFLLGYLSHLRN